MMILLKYSKLIEVDNNTYIIQNKMKLFSPLLNNELFNALWNKVQWSFFYPSMPAAAEQIFQSREELILLLDSYSNSIFLDELCDDYLLITGIKPDNHLLFTSFLDFSILRWFKFFGLIEYQVDNSSSRIKIESNPLLSTYAKRYL
jgi:hypothetical protein